MTAAEKSAQARGARMERRAWMAHLRRLNKATPPGRVKDVLMRLLAFGDTRDSRYNKAVGGLGRK